MSDKLPEWLSKLIDKQKSSVVENMLRGHSRLPEPSFAHLPVPSASAGLPAGLPASLPAALNPDRYLFQVLYRYRVNEMRRMAALRTARSLFPMIRQWAGPYLRSLDFSGSMRKGTAVLGTTDLDLFISLAHEWPDKLGDIYASLLYVARQNSLSPVPQNVSIRISYQGYDIDLVPARRLPFSTTYHSLYRRKIGRWTQTNVQRHISYVRNSGRLWEIRATKIWRSLHGLDFSSFLLELAVIDALTGARVGLTAKNFSEVLYYLGYVFPGARLVDPANTSNVVSDDLTAAEKQEIASRAQISLALGDLWKVIW